MKEGWKMMKIEEVISELRTGLNPRVHFKLNTDDAEGYYITVRELKGFNFKVDEKTDRINEAAIKRINERSHLKIDDVLFSGTGTLGKTALVAEEPTWWNIKEGVYALTPKKEVLDSKYLIYGFHSDVIMSKIYSKASGTTIKSIPMKELNKVEIPVPPLSDQHRIVSYLDTSFAQIDALAKQAEESLENAKALFQATLKELMEKKEGWEEKKLGEICDIFGRIGFRGYTKNDLVQTPKEGAITLSPSNIQNGRMDYTNCTYISWYKYEESPEIKINNGDVLIVKTGSSYGKSAFVENLPHSATINPQSVVIKNIKINNKFFAYYIRTPWVIKEFDNFVGGTAIPTFSQAKLSTLLIHYPNQKEQIKIVQTLDTLSQHISQLQSNYTQTLANCQALKQALLRETFE